MRIEKDIKLGEKLLISATYTCIGSNQMMVSNNFEVLFKKEFCEYVVTPPVYCYGNELQLATMAQALAKTAFIQMLINLSANDFAYKEIMDKTREIEMSNVVITRKGYSKAPQFPIEVVPH